MTVTIIQIVLSALVTYFANYAARWLTQPRNIIMNVKPFTCTECLSFWLAFLPCAAIAFLLPNPVLGVALSASLGLINYFFNQSQIVD